MPSAGTLDAFDADAALTGLTELLDHRANYAARLDRTAGALEEKAMENDRWLLELLKGGV